MRTVRPFLVAVLVLLAGTAARPAQAKSHIADILNKGSRWTLNVDGETGVLEILGGQGHQTPDGGWEMQMDVTWQGHGGKLYGRADGQNREQHVTLKVVNRSGIRVICSGLVAQYTGNLMAGTSRYSAVPRDIRGAWFAGKHPQAPPAPSPVLGGEGPRSRSKVLPVPVYSPNPRGARR